MNKQEAFIEINKLQDEYVDELIGLINSPAYSSMKAINFTSPTADKSNLFPLKYVYYVEQISRGTTKPTDTFNI